MGGSDYGKDQVADRTNDGHSTLSKPLMNVTVEIRSEEIARRKGYKDKGHMGVR